MMSTSPPRGKLIFFVFILPSNQISTKFPFFITVERGIPNITIDLNSLCQYPRQNHHQPVKLLPMSAGWPLELPAFRTGLGAALAPSPAQMPRCLCCEKSGIQRAPAQVPRALKQACALCIYLRSPLLPFCSSYSERRWEAAGRPANVPPAPFQSCPGHSFPTSFICMQVLCRAGEGSA